MSNLVSVQTESGCMRTGPAAWQIAGFLINESSVYLLFGVNMAAYLSLSSAYSIWSAVVFSLQINGEWAKDMWEEWGGSAVKFHNTKTQRKNYLGGDNGRSGWNASQNCLDLLSMSVWSRACGRCSWVGRLFLWQNGVWWLSCKLNPLTVWEHKMWVIWVFIYSLISEFICHSMFYFVL